MRKSDIFGILENGPTNPSLETEVFQELSPGEIQNMLDRDEAERLGQSISIRDFEKSGFHPGSSTKKKFPDFSMGQYFENRSSYPFPNLNDNITVMSDPPYPQDLPEKDITVPRMSHSSTHNGEPLPSSAFLSPSHFQRMDSIGSIADTPQFIQKASYPPPPESLRHQERDSYTSFDAAAERRESVAQSMEEHNGSINSLAQFFQDPDKSPMTSTDIMGYVLQYCKKKSTTTTSHKPIQKQNGHRDEDHSRGDFFTSQSIIMTNQISHIDAVDQSHRLRESDHYDTFSKIRSKVIPPTNSRLLEESHNRQRDLEAYKNFSQQLTQKMRLSRCSTPDTNSACSSVSQKSSSERSTPDQIGSSCSSDPGSQASKSKTLTGVTTAINTNIKTNENVNFKAIQRSLESDFQNCLTMSTMSISKTVNVRERKTAPKVQYQKQQSASTTTTSEMSVQQHPQKQLQPKPPINANAMQVHHQQQLQQIDNNNQAQQQMTSSQNPFQVQLNIPMQPQNGPAMPNNMPLVINFTVPHCMMPPPQSTDPNGNGSSQPRLSLQFSGSVQWHQ